MSETQNEKQLWGREGFRDDPYIEAESLEVAGDAPDVILPLAAWLGLDDEVRRTSNRRIGVSVAPGEDIGPLLEKLDTIPLIALQFPAFNDGRSYSKAELLKGRHGFSGELRAVGDVLIDQVVFMLRAGFDTLQVTNPVALERLNARDLHDTPGYYQPGRGSAQANGTFSWRRTPAA
ncbi:DUF934 domain-containing protein [Phyllobacterium salinisoli]|uniref:DUF934 domain-containing protein n=1 Tax=Phyllobacterium salinisoli TaxID=1899321 RepID=A0A368K9U3_9HYPH|nr:DUF934 domain-containing protein [Phyllobacterium salinisoli]RCS24860.1 DUF934 domain-containing protein [Phyllobacterium salinisoli]